MSHGINNKIVIITLSFFLILIASTLSPLVLGTSLFGTHGAQDLDTNPGSIDSENFQEPGQADHKRQVNTDAYLEYLRTHFRPDDIIDDYLREMLSASASTDQLEVIIQFVTGPTETELELLTERGFEIIHEYTTIPALFAKGNKHSILDLAESKNIYWIEYNEPIEFQMEKSLSVINATKTWNTIIRDENGNEHAGIDGSGVTVVVLDTGIDAGHPDLDYQEKTIMNLKSDFGFGPWVEMENSDTSYGHGTHCAGTVAGNGDASAGARRGVAPGANLVGLSIGDFGVNLANAVGGYEWIYDNTKQYTGEPSDNNIRVVSNSWGPSSSKFDPTDVISQMIFKCTVDNNVVSVFAAGNSGEDDHDGHKVETNPYGSTPMSIMVAATERDGSGLAYFSSRGQIELNETWPDVAAPGVKIWSATARRTYISAMMNLQDWSDLDPYYFAISGTSMATPHVAGAVALLFQACPSLRLSAQHDDFSDLDNESYSGLEESWWESPITLVHEAELILEASAGYMEPDSDNGVPHNNTIGWTGKRSDFAQGYGLINVENAIAIALTLNELRTRDFDGDGNPDYPNATVHAAIKQYKNIITLDNTTASNNKLTSHWEGDWTRFINQTTSPNMVLTTDQSHFVYIPEDANRLVLGLHYDPVSTSDEIISAAGIRLVIDLDGDGSPDWEGSTLPRDQPDEIDLTGGGFSSNLGKLWNFNIEGFGFGLPNIPPGNFLGESYYEVTVEYSVDLEIIFDTMPNATINQEFSNFDINNPKIGNLIPSGTANIDQDGVKLFSSFFNLNNVHPLEKPVKKKEKEEMQYPWFIWLLLAIALAILIILIYLKERKGKKEEIK